LIAGSGKDEVIWIIHTIKVVSFKERLFIEEIYLDLGAMKELGVW
jgi:hypothetical protein